MDKKVKRLFDLALVAVIIGGTIYLCNTYIPKIGNAVEKNRAKRELEAKQLQEDIDAFNKHKLDFRTTHNDSEIAKATLQNPNIASKEDKAYMYRKLKEARNKVVECSYDMVDNCDIFAEQFTDLLNSTSLPKDALEAKLFSLHEQDKEIQAQMAIAAKQEVESLKHKRDLEKIDAEKDKELAVYEAKLKAEQAKLKTVCETMKNADKKVQANVNVKTDLEV